jgi:hypothetical protein
MGKLTQSTECHQSKCDRVLVVCHTRNDRRAFHGSTMGKLTQSTECHQSKRDRVLVVCHTRNDRRAFHGSTMGKLTQSTECHQSKCDRVLVVRQVNFGGFKKVTMVPNVGANGIACGNLRYALQDIIEVIRFLYLSHREGSPTTNKSKVDLTDY